MRIAPRIVWLALLFGLSMPLFAAVKAPAEKSTLESVVVMQIDGSLSIDAAGRVAEFRIDTPLDDGLRASLDLAVLKWRFRPVLIDGVARNARAKMRIVLAARETDGGYKVNVDNVIFPEGTATGLKQPITEQITSRSLKPPKYPPGLNMARVTGTVLLGIRVGSDGRAAEVVAIQSMLFDIKGRDSVLADAIRGFEQSSIDAAKRWTFNVPVGMPATAELMTVAVPVEYSLEKRQRAELPGTWRTVVRAPRKPPHWLEDAPDVQKVGVTDVVSGEMIPSAGALTFASDVVGTAL